MISFGFEGKLNIFMDSIEDINKLNVRIVFLILLQNSESVIHVYF